MLTALWQTKTAISFPLEDKHVVNEHHVIRKSHDTVQEICPHVVHFNVQRDWFETNSRHQKRRCRSLLGRVTVSFAYVTHSRIKKCRSTLADLHFAHGLESKYFVL